MDRHELRVSLTEKSVFAMASISLIEDVSETDAVNRALQVWAELCRHRAAGGNVLLESADGSTTFLAIV